MRKVQVNTRFLDHELTGVQRYTKEISKYIGASLIPIAPSVGASGIQGHLWEQFILPFRLNRNQLFWNPTCPGPIAVSNQVVTVHDLSAIEHPEWFDWKYALWNRALIPPLLHRVRHIITVSNYTQSRIHELFGVPRVKMTTIYNGVGEQFFPRSADEVENMRSALELPAGPYVLSLSALQPRKNLQRLLQAWDLLQGEGEEATLVLAGGAGRPTIFHSFSLDRIPENVVFTGYVKDSLLPALYSGASAFVYPSLYEGFGLPVLEGMACGTPAVTSNRTSLPEVAGKGALLVDPFDTKAMARAINQLLHDEELHVRLEKQGREHAKEFRWKKTASQTLSVLRREE